MCRSRRELSNKYLLAKIGVDTAENEPLEVGGQNNSIFIRLLSSTGRVPAGVLAALGPQPPRGASRGSGQSASAGKTEQAERGRCADERAAEPSSLRCAQLEPFFDWLSIFYKNKLFCCSGTSKSLSKVFSFWQTSLVRRNVAICSNICRELCRLDSTYHFDRNLWIREIGRALLMFIVFQNFI